jgi:hypothetical protein
MTSRRTGDKPRKHPVRQLNSCCLPVRIPATATALGELAASTVDALRQYLYPAERGPCFSITIRATLPACRPVLVVAGRQTGIGGQPAGSDDDVARAQRVVHREIDWRQAGRTVAVAGAIGA